MAIPRSLQIGPHRITLSIDEAEINARSNASGSDLTGQWEPRTNTIAIRPKLAPDQEAETVLHEVLHVLTSLSGIADEHADLEESIVNRLAPGLLDTLRRNPALVHYLTGERQEDNDGPG